MITFQKFLNEEISPEDIKKFLKMAQHKAYSYLLAAQGQFCFRGMEDKKEIIFNKKVRKDRRPTDMSKTMSKRLDDAFNAVFDIRGRSQCVFVTGDESTAIRYGDPYYIFPKGNIHWLWSEKVEDLFKIAKSKTSEVAKMDQDDLEYWVKTNYTKDQSLSKAIRSGNEIMIECKNYMAISSDYYDAIKGRIR